MPFERPSNFLRGEAREIVFDKQFVAGRLHSNRQKTIDRMYARNTLQVVTVERTRKFEAGLYFRHRESE